jgi:hypothetical protein
MRDKARSKIVVLRQTAPPASPNVPMHVRSRLGRRPGIRDIGASVSIAFCSVPRKLYAQGLWTNHNARLVSSSLTWRAPVITC